MIDVLNWAWVWVICSLAFALGWGVRALIEGERDRASCPIPGCARTWPAQDREGFELSRTTIYLATAHDLERLAAVQLAEDIIRGGIDD